jgi:arsenate reductase
MVEGFLKSFDDFLDIYSAGTKPESKVNPNAVQVMEEMGIDISKNQPKSVDPYTGKAFDYVITVCDEAKEICPVFTGDVKNRLHIGFDDPADATGTKEEILAEFRRIRNEILVDFFAFYQTEIKK